MANEPNNSNKTINKIIKTKERRPQNPMVQPSKKIRKNLRKNKKGGNYKNVSVEAGEKYEMHAHTHDALREMVGKARFSFVYSDIHKEAIFSFSAQNTPSPGKKMKQIEWKSERKTNSVLLWWPTEAKGIFVSFRTQKSATTSRSQQLLSTGHWAWLREAWVWLWMGIWMGMWMWARTVADYNVCKSKLYSHVRMYYCGLCPTSGNRQPSTIYHQPSTGHTSPYPHPHPLLQVHQRRRSFVIVILMIASGTYRGGQDNRVASENGSNFSKDYGVNRLREIIS